MSKWCLILRKVSGTHDTIFITPSASRAEQQPKVTKTPLYPEGDITACGKYGKIFTATPTRAQCFHWMLCVNITKGGRGEPSSFGRCYSYYCYLFWAVQFNFKRKCESIAKVLWNNSNIEFGSPEASVSLSCLWLNIQSQLQSFNLQLLLTESDVLTLCQRETEFPIVLH